MRGGGTVVPVGRRAAWVGIAVVLAVASGVGPATAASASGDAISGADAWAATPRAGSAAVQLWIAQAGSPSGERPDRLHSRGGTDWRRHRSWQRFELAGVGTELGNMSGPVQVEVRVIRRVAYVRDGSWTCPGCGFDSGEPVPTDRWIRLTDPRARQMVHPRSLDVLASLHRPVPAVRTVSRGGATLTVHRTRVGGRWLEFTVDGHDRVRRVAYGAHLGGGRAREVVTFDRFGSPQPVVRPPARDVYRGTV